MGKILIAIMIFLYGTQAIAQAPFSTLVKEPRVLEVKNTQENQSKLLAVTDDTSLVVFFRNKSESVNTSLIQESIKTDVDFFENNGLSLSLINKGENRISISSQVLHYKLFFANPSEENISRTFRYNIPLLLISRLSTTYDSINSSTSLDIIDYEASPITLRIMPSFKKAYSNYNDAFYYGFYIDLRGLNFFNLDSETYEIDIVGGSGVGLTYQGDGQAGSYNPNGEYESGRYSISVIFQGAIGKKSTIARLFETEKQYVTAIQTYFLFKASEVSHLNIKIGYQYFFQSTVSGNKSNFSIAIGI